MHSASPAPRRAARPTFWKRLWAGRRAYLFLLPTFVLLGYFAYYPAYIAFTRAFTDWDGFNPPTFTGLENFRRALTDPAMGQASANVGLWIVLGLLLAVIPPLVVAELIFHLRGPRRQYAYRTLFVVPIVVPSLVLLLLWTTFYRTDGVLNQLLGSVGLGAWQRSWLADQDTALYALIFLGFPYVDAFYLLLLYAGLQSIPKDVLEAAKLDGAVGPRRVWTIDLPLLRPQLFLIAVLSVIGNAQYFLSPLVITSGGPGYATTVPALLMYNTAVKFGEYGYALSIAALLFVVIVLLTVVAQRVARAQGD
ncbi:carbohydrate ABC transporter permease [Deinococcus yavapaiensis]|uniref:Carbohydrate ABC transporter membrane protein 1 (CUT1 family) n=1 Tax=Deinococcus yavapaiensis KR-236 TaxID=694435 RepID=A0A318S808_9DEIO|nr:sugar ABC transporter permease [Deinococcus yavapaiensis]PYE51911.1 carbohydrate ABC transporter membrane protein 1 (CUT1 family) [Deinococcus yavapaiensis KR-236]